MFLWYLVCLERDKLDSLLKNNTSHLKIRFGGLTENALDIYCSQLKHQELNENERLISSFSEIENRYFGEFAKWMNMILTEKSQGISVNKYKHLALFIAGAVELGISPEELSDEQWKLTGEFIRSSRKVGKELLGGDNKYPEPKGLWKGKSGQFRQCDAAVDIARKILINVEFL
ncbi:MAG: hypothetical protein WBA93_06820 [Microcoleaceae cyanobacterium]